MLETVVSYKRDSQNDLRRKSTGSLFGIQVFAKAITDEVEGKYGKRDRYAGKYQRVWGGLKCREVAGFFDHYAP